MGQYKTWWYALAAVCAITISLSFYMGGEIRREAPPIPLRFVSAKGDVLTGRQEILQGQSAWQNAGGMAAGSVLGQGSYQAPDWTADWLHRELTAWLDIAAHQQYGKAYADLDSGSQTVLRDRMKTEYREHSAMAADGTVTLSDTRIRAVQQITPYYTDLFGSNTFDENITAARTAYAMLPESLPDPQARRQMTRFFFWTAWIASADRPGSSATYTGNWPHEPLIDNRPTDAHYRWSALSVLLLSGAAALLLRVMRRFGQPEHAAAAAADPIAALPLTGSQRALWKFAALTVLLFAAQVLIGCMVSYYAATGKVLPLLPYPLLRGWHVQAALLWIATGFLTAGLFAAPIVNGGQDPRGQRRLVNILFGLLLAVLLGTFAGSFAALSHLMPLPQRFWFGNQAYEYAELGRFWQLLLFAALLLWLFLMLRCTLPACLRSGSRYPAVLLALAAAAVALLYAPAMLYEEHTVITVTEYSRSWLVQGWIKGGCDMFAAAVMAVLLHRLQLLDERSATLWTLATAVLFAAGSLPAVVQQLYFTGTAAPVMAAGAVFSALSSLPPLLMAYRVRHYRRCLHPAAWTIRLRWPLMCFAAAAFWNVSGGSLSGLFAAPPLSQFYLKGLNAAAMYAHVSLFGVYGMLALGLVLLSGCYIKPHYAYAEKPMTVGFWLLNGGMLLMIVSSLLPVAVFQAHAAITRGLWYARSSEFTQQGYLVVFRWIRTIANLMFAGGACLLAWQVLRMAFSRKKAR